MTGDADQDDGPPLPGLRQRAPAQKRAQPARGSARPVPGVQETLVLVPTPTSYPAEERARVLRAHQDWMSTRAIQRTFGVCYQTLMRWVGEKSRRPAGSGGHAAAGAKG